MSHFTFLAAGEGFVWKSSEVSISIDKTDGAKRNHPEAARLYGLAEFFQRAVLLVGSVVSQIVQLAVQQLVRLSVSFGVKDFSYSEYIIYHICFMMLVLQFKTLKICN